MIREDKFVFIVVHPPRQVPDKNQKQRKDFDLSLIFNKRKILKYFGTKNPFTTVTDQVPNSSSPLYWTSKYDG